MTDDIPKVLDIRLFAGDKSSNKTRNFKFNTLRGILNQKSNECWCCNYLNTCGIGRIFKCPKVKEITKHLNKENFL